MAKKTPPEPAPPDDNVYLILAPPSAGVACKQTAELEKARNLFEVGPYPCQYLIDNKYSDLSIGSGFLDKQEKRAFFDNGKPFRDFEFYGDYYLLSEKALRLFQSVAPGATDAKEADVYAARGADRDKLPGYWTCDVTLFLDAVDEEKSRVSWHTNRHGGKFYDGDYGHTYRREALGSANLFRLMKSPLHVFCTAEMKSAVKAAKLTGIKFVEYGRIG